MKRVISIWLLVFSILTLAAVEKVNFLSKPLTAGKASLTENSFFLPQFLGTANFSPDLRFPIQLIYNSASEKTGIFGYAWRSPQLESSAVPQRDGVLWTTPWGEQIKFFPKKEKASKDSIKIELYEQAKKAGDFILPIPNGKHCVPRGILPNQALGFLTVNEANRDGNSFTVMPDYRKSRLHQDAPSNSLTPKGNSSALPRTTCH